MLDGRLARSQTHVDVHDARHAIQGTGHVSHAGAARHPVYGKRRCADFWLVVAWELFHIQVTHPRSVHYTTCRVDPRVSAGAGLSDPGSVSVWQDTTFNRFSVKMF